MMMMVVSEGWDEKDRDGDIGGYGICGPSPEQMEKAAKHTHVVDVKTVGIVRVYPVMRRIEFLDAWGYEWSPSMEEAERGCSGEHFGWFKGTEEEALNPEMIARMYDEYMMSAE